MADVFYRAPGADAFDLWSGDSHDPRDVHSAYEAMSRQEQDLAAARRRALFADEKTLLSETLASLRDV